MAKNYTPPPSQQPQAPAPRIVRVYFERPLQVLGGVERIAASPTVTISAHAHGVTIQTPSASELIPWHLVHSLSLERGAP